jgi:hypothetical protein
MALTVITSGITSITTISATGGGFISATTGITVSARGIVWNTTPNPTLANFKTTNGSGVGSFSSSLTGLQANNTYYVKAYATTTSGTTYGSQVVFSTTLSVQLTDDQYNLWKKIGYVSPVTPTDQSVARQLAILDAKSIINEQP